MTISSTVGPSGGLVGLGGGVVGPSAPSSGGGGYFTVWYWCDPYFAPRYWNKPSGAPAPAFKPWWATYANRYLGRQCSSTTPS